MQGEHKPLIGITCGDINGIGPEVIMKTLSDSRILDHCTPIVFGNSRLFNFYRKVLPDNNINFFNVKDFTRVNPKQVNLFNCWEDDAAITPGQLTEAGGKYAVISLQAATEALKSGKIHGLVTAPIHKKNTQGPSFDFTGHTPYLKAVYNVRDVLMLMIAENMRIGLLSEHVPIQDVSKYLTRENLVSKLILLQQSLKKDFNITRPRIAVLGLNPHAGDEGLIGKEESEIIVPLLKELRQKDMLCYGPYSADAFFARGHFQKFDGVLALYHDQGLIPFKSLAIGEGVNFTAGLPGVRTSPDHGVAFDIAGKGIADESSFRAALFCCLEVIHGRSENASQYRNPLKKRSASVVANAIDEKISED